MISRSRALRLKPLLDALLDREEMAARVPFDPVRFARRFTRPDDVEVSGLVAACLAYGRADQFGARLEELFARIGEHPGEFARGFQARRDAKVFRGIAYRFNGPADLAALVSAAGRIQNEQGSLGALFEKEYAREADLKKSLASFARARRDGVDPFQRICQGVRARPMLTELPSISPMRRSCRLDLR